MKVKMSWLRNSPHFFGEWWAYRNHTNLLDFSLFLIWKTCIQPISGAIIIFAPLAFLSIIGTTIAFLFGYKINKNVPSGKFPISKMEKLPKVFGWRVLPIYFVIVTIIMTTYLHPLVTLTVLYWLLKATLYFCIFYFAVFVIMIITAMLLKIIDRSGFFTNKHMKRWKELVFVEIEFVDSE